ncbi:MAG: hypothetical protein M3N24_07110, partial [Actinomycetota bacterium]|nr:hypothetical protein [Actinomycetota bacterium]
MDPIEIVDRLPGWLSALRIAQRCLGGQECQAFSGASHGISNDKKGAQAIRLSALFALRRCLTGDRSLFIQDRRWLGVGDEATAATGLNAARGVNHTTAAATAGGVNHTTAATTRVGVLAGRVTDTAAATNVGRRGRRRIVTAATTATNVGRRGRRRIVTAATTAAATCRRRTVLHPEHL